MALTEQQQTETMRELVRKMFVEVNVTATLTTADVKAAIAAIDDFMTVKTTAQLNSAGALTGSKTMAGNLNDYLPEPFKSTTTQAQKALAVAYWALKTGGLI